MHIWNILIIFYLFQQILWEVTAGQLGTAPAVVTENPGSIAASTSAEEEVEDDKELEEMKSRLQSLRS